MQISTEIMDLGITIIKGHYTTEEKQQTLLTPDGSTPNTADELFLTKMNLNQIKLLNLTTSFLEKQRTKYYIKQYTYDVVIRMQNLGNYRRY